jgi:hypothetical protein
MAISCERETAAIDLDAAGLDLAQRRVAELTLKGGRLRPRMPPLRWYEARDSESGAAVRVTHPDDALAFYLWRILAWYLSPDPMLQGTPERPGRFLPGGRAQRERALAAMELVARKILAGVPRGDWHAYNRRREIGAGDLPGPRLH